MTKKERTGKTKSMKDENKVYLPADKGRIMVAMDRWESQGGENLYEFKMKQVLVDLKVKPSIRAGKDWDLMGKVCRDGAKIIENIVQRNELSEEDGGYLKPKDCHAPRLSGLPKIHKERVPLRGIVSTVGSPFERISRYLIPILHTIQGRSGLFVKNSRELKERVKKWRVEGDKILVMVQWTSKCWAMKLDYLQRLLVGLNVDDSVVAMVGQAYSVLNELDNADEELEMRSTASTVRTGRCGRPSFDVKREQLVYLLEQGFKVSDISKIVGVCQRTVERRMSSFGLSVSGMYSNISDEQLDEYVITASREHPDIGIRMLKGYLRSKGMRVQRHRIRSALLRTDPIGLLGRWQKAIKRRCYNVKFALSLWHIDGNHKLIRYFYL
ncbi:uncharacterized protein LOC110052565 [Paramuricea clavata]|uniref:Uncharacterized protein LOC110052565 n=1 Tax=Paramuricea clavata TaxID=317549 RepID=A0A6S7GZF8_PARCT|nr:uncharacterized protein LOC110052565 [Paramuricea clavata]